MSAEPIILLLLNNSSIYQSPPYPPFCTKASFFPAPILRASLSSLGQLVIRWPKPPQKAQPFTPPISKASSSGSSSACNT